MAVTQKTAFCPVPRVSKIIEGDRLKAFLTAAEIRYCMKKKYSAEPAAARIAAKKALLQLLKVSASAQKKWMLEVEVSNRSDGKPFFKLSAAFRKKFGIKPPKILLSLAHERELAAAWVGLKV